MLTTILKTDYAADGRKQGVILATANICARLQRCPTLPYDDAATKNRLAAKYLHSQPLCIGVAAVFRRT